MAPEREPAPVVVDGLVGEPLPKRALVVRFKASRTNGTAMPGEWRQKTKPKVTSRMACEALAGCSVTLGGSGMSKRAMQRTHRTATNAVQGAARAISPDNKTLSPLVV